MPKIKNTSGEDRIVPALGGRLVLAGQVVDVPEGDVYGFTQQTLWEPADDAARSEHDESHAAYEERAGFAPTAEEPSERPANNAKRDVWAAYVVGRGLATAEQVDGMSRDEIRDTYSNDGSL